MVMFKLNLSKYIFNIIFRLLFLNLVKNRLIRNTQKREGLCELSIQTLKSMSPKWVVIPVCEENWGGMLLQEKAATLKAIINSELARNPV